MILLLFCTARALAGLTPMGDPPPRYLDEAAVIEGIEAGQSAIARCFPAGSPSVIVPVTLQITREGTVREVRLPTPPDPKRDPCLEAALSGLRFRPHDEPVDTWSTTLAWVDGALRSWPVVQRIPRPRGPILLRVPANVASIVAEALGVDPFPPPAAPGTPPPAEDRPTQDDH
ncbi:MAG: hypothetical protein JXB39_10025 [Deltaproteobacteria bacterium]|nr:hypothetical protein [Deltaproteobacteria bacterium]